MSKKITLIAITFGLFLIAASFSSCSKKNEPLQNEQTYDEMVAERLRNQPVPPIDPSICKDNPEGYVYFQAGEEIFRYTKDSPIQVARVSSIAQRGLNEPVMSVHIPEGCKGNPYRQVPLSFNYKEGETLIGMFRLEKFGISGVPQGLYERISPAQGLIEKKFNQVKKSYDKCDMNIKNLTRCLIDGEDTKGLNGQRSSYYMADKAIYSTGLNHSFVLACESYVGNILCESHYRIYPTADLRYSFFPESLNEKNIIVFDQYIRQLIENMRVGDESNVLVAPVLPPHN